MILKLLKYSKNLNIYLGYSFLFSMLGAFIQVSIIFGLFYGLVTFSFSFTMILILIGAVCIEGVCNYLEQYLGHYVAFKVLADLRREVYQKIRELGPAKLDTKNRSKIIALIHTDIELVEVFFAHTIVPILKGGIMLLLFTGIYSCFLGYIGVLVFCSYLFIGFILPFYKKIRIFKLNKKLMEQKEQTQVYVLESIKGCFEISQFNMINKRKLEMRRLIDQEVFSSKEIKMIAKERDYYVEIVILVIWFFIFSLVSYFDDWNASNQVLVLSYPFTFRSQISLSKLSLSLGKSIASIKNLLNFFYEENSFFTGCKEMSNITQIEAKRLKFHYPNSTECIFSDLDISFTLDGITGILGENGSGKSTFVKLLMRWYDYQSGELKIGENELKDVDLDSIRGNINYVPQNPQILNGSIRENLTLCCEISDEKIWQILEDVELSDKIIGLSQNLDTLLGNGPIPFSSGELQRLELARALLHKSQLLILDEPTSNLDLKNEQIFLDVLKKNRQKGVIIISHRERALEIVNKKIQVSQRRLSLIDS